MQPTQMAVQIEWHSPDQVYAAAFLRDGQPWYLNGALVGMGGTPGAAVDDLLGLAGHLVLEGRNFFMDDDVSPADRRWLFERLEPNTTDAQYVAVQQADPGKR